MKLTKKVLVVLCFLSLLAVPACELSNSPEGERALENSESIQLSLEASYGPEMTTFIPENGQSHEIGYLAENGGISWISTWTEYSGDSAGSLLKTDQVNLPAGKYAVLYQVWHKEGDGDYLGELRAYSGTQVIASKELISEKFPSYLDGGYQRAVLAIDLAVDTEDLSFELYYGSNEYIWAGAVNVTPIDTRRPFYNIAHRCSTISKVDDMVSKNANAIEFDVTPVKQNGEIVFKVYHSGDILHTPVSKFDRFLANLKSHLDNRNIALVEFDCKQDSSIDAAAYARALAARIKDAGIPAGLTVMSVPKAQAAIFSTELKGGETPLFDCGIDSYLEGYGDLTAEEWAVEVENTGATFIGVGIAAIAPSPMPGWMPWIQTMTNRRDKVKNFKKAYFWTLNSKTSMRKCLDYGVDGIITNYPARLHEVMQEEPYRGIVRPATQSDSQFEVHGFK